MLRDEDLQVAVAEGILTDAQAASLRALVAKRETARAVELGHEERFTFLRSFNDFFFAVGIALFGGGMAFFALPTPAGGLIAAIIAWTLAELLVRRMRLVLPGILLACIFVVFFTLAMPVDLWLLSGWQQIDLATLQDWFTRTRLQAVPAMIRGSPFLAMMIYALIGAAAAALFYLRFRLPFALLLIAGNLVSAAVAALYYVWTKPSETQILTFPSSDVQSYVLLGCGLLTFIAAMAYDFSDRERLTRRADCAFWLHLLAAPLIVHSLIKLVTPQLHTLTTPAALAILGIFVVLTVIAIAIDRRALLVAALIYVGTVISFGISSTTIPVGSQGDRHAFVLFTTLLLLGSLVLILGVGWRVLRRLLLRILPSALGTRLPLVATA